MRSNRVPGRELVHGVMLLVAGVLLLTPGFVTDSLGFLLFVPAFRDVVWRLVRDRFTVEAMSARNSPGDRVARVAQQTMAWSISTPMSSSGIRMLLRHGRAIGAGFPTRTRMAVEWCKRVVTSVVKC
jgi:UPF0716 family protein affecting phage T7 exclusion